MARLRDVGAQGRCIVGSTRTRDRGLQPPPLGVDGADDPVARGGQPHGCAGRAAARRAASSSSEPDVSEGQRRLLRDVGEQPVFEGLGCRVQAGASGPTEPRRPDAVLDRHPSDAPPVDVGNITRSFRRPRRRQTGVAVVIAVEPDDRPLWMDRLARGGSDRRKQLVGGRAADRSVPLKSASASYGAARLPYARRSATPRTRRRSGWNANATTAVASNDQPEAAAGPCPQRSRPSATTRPT